MENSVCDLLHSLLRSRTNNFTQEFDHSAEYYNQGEITGDGDNACATEDRIIAQLQKALDEISDYGLGNVELDPLNKVCECGRSRGT